MRISDWSSDVCSSDLCRLIGFCRVLGATRLTPVESFSLLGQCVNFTTALGLASVEFFDRQRAFLRFDVGIKGIAAAIAAQAEIGQLEDRKSTRLNSSH